MGYFVGAFDLFGMRLVEIFEAIPQLFLLIAVVAVLDADLYTMMAIIGFVSWTQYARFLRAEFLRLRHQDFVQAARAAALPLPSILFRHMLPNGLAPILVAASFGVAELGPTAGGSPIQRGYVRLVDRDLPGAGDLPDRFRLQHDRRGHARRGRPAYRLSAVPARPGRVIPASGRAPGGTVPHAGRQGRSCAPRACPPSSA